MRFPFRSFFPRPHPVIYRLHYLSATLIHFNLLWFNVVTRSIFNGSKGVGSCPNQLSKRLNFTPSRNYTSTLLPVSTPCLCTSESLPKVLTYVQLLVIIVMAELDQCPSHKSAPLRTITGSLRASDRCPQKTDRHTSVGSPSQFFSGGE